jgi:hypothetical protein
MCHFSHYHPRGHPERRVALFGDVGGELSVDRATFDVVDRSVAALSVLGDLRELVAKPLEIRAHSDAILLGSLVPMQCG